MRTRSCVSATHNCPGPPPPHSPAGGCAPLLQLVAVPPILQLVAVPPFAAQLVALPPIYAMVKVSSAATLGLAEDSLADSAPLAHCATSTHRKQETVALDMPSLPAGRHGTSYWEEAELTTDMPSATVQNPSRVLTLSALFVEHCQVVLRDVRAHKANSDEGVRDIGKRPKIRKLKFCLAEAIRVRTCIALKSAWWLTIHADGSKGRLVVVVGGSCCNAAFSALRQPSVAL